MTTHTESNSKNAALRQRSPTRKYHSLIDKIYSIENLQRAYAKGAQRGGGPGSDGITWEDYARDLPRNLDNLSNKLRNSAFEFRPTSVRWINNDRPHPFQIHISCVEERIVQHALNRILAKCVEPYFLPVSYGYRKGRGPRKAYARLNEICETVSAPNVSRFDIRNCFGSMNRLRTMQVLCKYIADSRTISLIDQMLAVTKCEGLPSGNVLSILLSEMYFLDCDRLLVYDRMVRYCDTIVAVSSSLQQLEIDQGLVTSIVERVGLQLNSKKTRVWEYPSLERGIPSILDLFLN